MLQSAFNLRFHPQEGPAAVACQILTHVFDFAGAFWWGSSKFVKGLSKSLLGSLHDCENTHVVSSRMCVLVLCLCVCGWVRVVCVCVHVCVCLSLCLPPPPPPFSLSLSLSLSPFRPPPLKLAHAPVTALMYLTSSEESFLNLGTELLSACTLIAYI